MYHSCKENLAADHTSLLPYGRKQHQLRPWKAHRYALNYKAIVYSVNPKRETLREIPQYDLLLLAKLWITDNVKKIFVMQKASNVLFNLSLLALPSYPISLKGLGHTILGNFSTDQIVIELTKI